MSRRVRQSQAGPSGTQRESHSGLSAPAYEPPFLPLHMDAAARLGTIAKQERSVTGYITAALAALTASANDLGELTGRDLPASTEKAKRQAVLDQLDAAARATIDASNKVLSGKTILGELETVEKAKTEAQRRRRGRGEVESDDEEAPDVKVVSAGEGVWGRYKIQMDQGVEGYMAQDDRTKYGQVHEYIEFRRTLWDAQNPNTPMPNQRTWFASGPDADGDDNSGSDSDELEVAQEKQSFKCPLTLRDFEEPVKSTLCPHIFEKSAIFGMFRRGNQGVECPMPGCNKLLTKESMKVDTYILKKMQRTRKLEEAARRREEAEMEDEEEEEEEEGEVDGDGDVAMEDAGDVDPDADESIRIKTEGRKKSKRQAKRVLDLSEDDEE
ncbi:zinc-finger of the MIZ type in Nse subunit-domain-containing protein [Geopyxis carbonaria]|nr:zinc-finger of the MIZ type in Nse subunit-domain-containing protein [Geopyxis carbonaria]